MSSIPDPRSPHPLHDLGAAAPSEAGQSAHVPRLARMRGGALVVLGSVLAVALVLGLVELGPMALGPASSTDSARFTGRSDQGLAVLALMVWATLTSVFFIAGGLQLLRKGRLQGWVKAWGAAVVVALVVMLWRVNALLG